MRHLGLKKIKIDKEATKAARDKETEEFLKEYRKFLKKYRKQQENQEISPEELAEMRNAFGEGETVVDVITGKEIKL